MTQCEGQEVDNSGHLVAEKTLQHSSLHIRMKRLHFAATVSAKPVIFANHQKNLFKCITNTGALKPVAIISNCFEK